MSSHITLVYLARLRERFGAARETLPLAGETTVAGLLETLRARGGEFAVELAAGRAFRVAVNQEVAGPEQRIVAGDEVAIFPPVTGG
ncbi:MAG: molybdopterin converting factor subunit 1 [Burkholderiales bacterium]|nr:molybdopterin converting factor subunit 1 [Burkholderiales bacterium]